MPEARRHRDTEVQVTPAKSMIHVGSLMVAAVVFVGLALVQGNEGAWLLLFLTLALLSRAALPGDRRIRGWDDTSLVGPTPPHPRPQLAGVRCAHCAQRITTELEARVCASCSAPLHRECMKEHSVDAHRASSGQAYR
jgi:hypothetical protein